MFSFIKETKTNFDNLRAMEDTRDSGFKDMLDTSNSFSSNMESVEGLTAQVDLMTEERGRPQSWRTSQKKLPS